MRFAIIAIACAALHGCSSGLSGSVRMSDRPVDRVQARNPSLIFNPNSTSAAASFVRSDWPSTPRKWAKMSEEVWWQETVRDYQGGGYGRYGGGDYYRRVFRSERRGRAHARD